MLEKALKLAPDLDAAGFGADDTTRPCGQGSAPFGTREARQVVLCCDWLHRRTEPAKTASRGSYGLKHVVERQVGEYVSNGAFLAAALALGYRVDRNGINGRVYLKYRRGSR